MKAAIMQPYFLPYIGYWQLMYEVDIFVVYDEIEYTRKGWMNRNRYLLNGSWEYFTLPLKKDSDFLPVSKRFLSSDIADAKQKILRKLKASYQKAPEFQHCWPLFENIFHHEETNLFLFVFNSITQIKSALGIDTEMMVSSSIEFDNSLKAQDKIIEICKCIGATEYINPIGGVELYDPAVFDHHGIHLRFHRAIPRAYSQFHHEFIPFLSILDVMMFNPIDQVQNMIRNDYLVCKKEQHDILLG